MPPPSINIIGSGSMGHLWTAYLLDNQAYVRLYAKQSKDSQKITVKSPKRCFSCNINYHSLKDWQISDFIIICVKTTSLEALCVDLQSIHQSDTPIILMMNGMGIIEIAKQYFPEAKIYQASTSHGARLERNNLLHTGKGETLIGSIQTGDIPTEQINNQGKSSTLKYPIAPLIEQLNLALPKTRWNSNHQEALWTKLLINAIINPLTTIYEVQNGDLVNKKQIKQQAKRLTQQLSPIIHKYLPNECWQSIFEKVEYVANQTYTNVSSMRQDILMGKKTEIDFITGYLLKIAATQNIALPEHEQIVKQIKTLEKEPKHS